MDKMKSYFYLLPTIAMIGSSIGKFVGLAPIVESMTAINLQDRIAQIGALELVCALLFLFPKTRMIGFFLVCSYWGGAIAADLTAGIIAYVPMAFLAMFWIGLYFQKPSLFIPKEA